jgi:hypothetical protein
MQQSVLYDMSHEGQEVLSRYTKILHKHEKVFGQIPPGQPPDRGFEHIIELEEGEKTIITTPYRHPKKHKDEIERH